MSFFDDAWSFIETHVDDIAKGTGRLFDGGSHWSVFNTDEPIDHNPYGDVGAYSGPAVGYQGNFDTLSTHPQEAPVDYHLGTDTSHADPTYHSNLH